MVTMMALAGAMLYLTFQAPFLSVGTGLSGWNDSLLSTHFQYCSWPVQR